jgi:hypothetical protein
MSNFSNSQILKIKKKSRTRDFFFFLKIPAVRDVCANNARDNKSILQTYQHF